MWLARLEVDLGAPALAFLDAICDEGVFQWD